MDKGNNKLTEEEVVETVEKFVNLILRTHNTEKEIYIQDSLCLSCEWFWRVCKDENEKCYRGGSNGGLIRYCTGYKRKGG